MNEMSANSIGMRQWNVAISEVGLCIVFFPLAKVGGRHVGAHGGRAVLLASGRFVVFFGGLDVAAGLSGSRGGLRVETFVVVFALPLRGGLRGRPHGMGKKSWLAASIEWNESTGRHCSPKPGILEGMLDCESSATAGNRGSRHGAEHGARQKVGMRQSDAEDCENCTPRECGSVVETSCMISSASSAGCAPFELVEEVRGTTLATPLYT